MSSIIVFLGSGVSKPSGLPLGNELAEKLGNPARRRGEVSFEHVDEGDTDKIFEVIHSFLKILSRHYKEFYEWRNDEDFPPRCPPDPSYEELFSMTNRLWGTIRGSEKDPVPHKFVEWVEKESNDLVQRLKETDVYSQGDMDPLQILARETILYINWVVRDALIGEPNPSSFRLLFDLIEAYDRVVIATLNHDTLVGQLLDEEGIEYEDGFGEPENDISWYAPERFKKNRDARVKLLKLHGSIDWWREYAKDSGKNGGRYFKHDVVEGTPDTEEVKSASLQPVFLTGIMKERQYTQGIFADMQGELYLEMRDTDRMLMSGYGGGDRGINRIVKRWLERSKYNTIHHLHKVNGRYEGEYPNSYKNPFEYKFPFSDAYGYEKREIFLCEARLEMGPVFYEK